MLNQSTIKVTYKYHFTLMLRLNTANKHLYNCAFSPLFRGVLANQICILFPDTEIIYRLQVTPKVNLWAKVYKERGCST